MVVGSEIFVRSRTLGCVCNGVPVVSRFLNKKRVHSIVSCVGRSFHIYESDRLTLLTASQMADDEITCLAVSQQAVFTATVSGVVQLWKGGRLIDKKYVADETVNGVRFLHWFGAHLIAVTETNFLLLWEISTGELALSLPLDPDFFNVTAITHPGTYLNKILLGSEQGSLQLWNLKSSMLVHTFTGWSAPVTALESAPALDVVGIGLADGRIFLHNIKFDETVVELKQNWGSVSCLSFRTDGPPILVSGSTSGHVVLWDLEERKVASQLCNGNPAHNGPITSVICLPSEPILVTTSTDNSLKMWIMDQIDGSARLLRLREGHASQPNLVRFSPSNSIHLISAGSDSSLRVYNLIKESMNVSLGKASYKKKMALKHKELEEELRMPPILEVSMSEAREKEWDSIVARHQGIPHVTSWSYDKRKMGAHKLLPPRLSQAHLDTVTETAQSLQLTNCGNFVVVGYSSGHIDRFNVQSGIHRCSYGFPKGHEGSVNGVAVGSLNQVVISGCSRGFIKFWRFRIPQTPDLCKQPIQSLDLGESVSFFRVHLESSLMAVVLDDFSIQVVDHETRRVVRKLKDHGGQITDACFSVDARWLISASCDSTIRTWHIPTGSLIDIIKTESPCISLAMSPSGFHLATAHVGQVGIHLWANRTVFSHVSLRPIKESEIIEKCEEVLDLYVLNEGDVEYEAPDEKEIDEEQVVEKEQIDNLTTLCHPATRKLRILVDFETIRSRNKKSASNDGLSRSITAPFFLPQLPSTLEKDVRFDVRQTQEELTESAISRLTLSSEIHRYQSLSTLEIVNRLLASTPSVLYHELTTASQADIGDVFQALQLMFKSKKNFELAEAIFAVILKSHTRLISTSSELVSELTVIQNYRSHMWKTLEQHLMFSLSIISFMKQKRS